MTRKENVTKEIERLQWKKISQMEMLPLFTGDDDVDRNHVNAKQKSSIVVPSKQGSAEQKYQESKVP